MRQTKKNNTKEEKYLDIICLNNLNLLKLLHINKKKKETPTETWGKYHKWAIQKRKNKNANNLMKKGSTRR